MADQKITQLTENTTPLVTDILPMVDDPAGTPATQKVTIANVLSLAYPVGSIYISTGSTSPATLFGVGTWSAFGAGRVLVSRDANDTDFDVSEETGGAKTKAISAHSGTAVADHASHTHTYTDVPNHVHIQQLPSSATGNFASGTRDTSAGGNGGTPGVVDDALSTKNPTGGVATGTTAGPSATLTHSVTQPSAHTDLNVVQPYIVVYMWKRTA